MGSFSVVCNDTHQGLVRAINCANLGCYTFSEADEPPLFPLTLSPDLPVFLVRAAPNFTKEALRKLGWAERAERLGVAKRLTTANLLPHGGGYGYPNLLDVSALQLPSGEREFELAWADGRHETIRHPRELPYAFRAMEVCDRLVELGLGEPVAEMEILHVIGGGRQP